MPVRNQLRNLRLAVGFLTVFPLAPGGAAQMGPARAYFPLVGLALGGILAGLDFAARQALPTEVVGALLVAALLVLTRAIHTEGFLDACDGLFGGYSRAKRLEILRDTHVGAFAVIGGATLLLLKWTLLVGIPDGARAGLLVVVPVSVPVRHGDDDGGLRLRQRERGSARRFRTGPAGGRSYSASPPPRRRAACFLDLPACCCWARLSPCPWGSAGGSRGCWEE